MIDYTGLDEAEILLALYKEAVVADQYADLDRPEFTIEEARKTLPQWPITEPGEIFVDYVFGRPVKFILYPVVKEIDVEQYDKAENVKSTGVDVLAALRAI